MVDSKTGVSLPGAKINFELWLTKKTKKVLCLVVVCGKPRFRSDHLHNTSIIFSPSWTSLAHFFWKSSDQRCCCHYFFHSLETLILQELNVWCDREFQGSNLRILFYTCLARYTPVFFRNVAWLGFRHPIPTWAHLPVQTLITYSKDSYLQSVAHG